MNDNPEHESAPDELLDMSGYLTLADAARILDVAESTVWRWVMREEIAAYRIGPRRVWLRKEDLPGLVRPVRLRGVHSGRTSRQRPREEKLMSADRQLEVQAALRKVAALRERIFAQRGGVPFDDSVAIIREMREEPDGELER